MAITSAVFGFHFRVQSNFSDVFGLYGLMGKRPMDLLMKVWIECQSSIVLQIRFRVSVYLYLVIFPLLFVQEMSLQFKRCAIKSDGMVVVSST